MISDFLQFLEYYSEASNVSARPYDDPLIRVEYDAVSKDGRLVLALMAPFAHAIQSLCYREPDSEAHYNQKNIAQVCCVSPAEVTAWKKEERIPEKYRWFLLLVDISGNVNDIYGHTLLHTHTQREAENICDIYLRMVKCCFDPYCQDDCILASAVRWGSGLQSVKNKLIETNPQYWNRVLKIHRA